MYLYVDKRTGLSSVPESLLAGFGEPAHAFDLLLDQGRKLARADAPKVLQAIEEKGFYLQMPPSEGEDAHPPFLERYE
jgi:uncharacterized protein YcgL (UPF0745 family)